MESNDTGKKVSSHGGTSFLIRILFRQNTSWQGMIQWIDGEKTRNFRSFLEMVTLIQEALSYTECNEEVIKFHSWEDKEEVS